MELCIGTVQFGLDYGIANQKKPTIDYAVKCLDYATQNGITAIDTAKAYGNAEEIVGYFLKKKTIPREKLFISTKLLPNLLDKYKPDEYERIIERELSNQLKTLHLDYVDAYIFHSARYAFNIQMLEALHRMKEKGLARKTGVSVYEPDEAMACFETPYVDFIQLPYSIFDHRMKKEGVLNIVHGTICEIHARSAFIQGLVMLQEDSVPLFLSKAKPIIRKINRICNETGISRVELALAYVKRESVISHLVFGVDSLEQLREDISLFHKEVSPTILEYIEREFEGIEANIVMPSLWKK